MSNLVILKELGSRLYAGKQRKFLLVKCSCGTKFEVNRSAVLTGSTKSCGCMSSSRRRVVTHGNSGTPTHRSWLAMKKRCYNPSVSPKYHYGKVKVCKRWRNDFQAFLKDMGERPEGMTLDRYPDPRGDYKPSNCRGATASQQQRNRRDNHEEWVLKKKDVEE